MNTTDCPVLVDAAGLEALAAQLEEFSKQSEAEANGAAHSTWLAGWHTGYAGAYKVAAEAIRKRIAYAK